MYNRTVFKFISMGLLPLAFAACKVPSATVRDVSKFTPATYKYSHSTDSTTIAKVQWREYFTDPDLRALIDTALNNNQELNITRQEIEIARNEIRARKGEYLPYVGLKAGAGAGKVSRYTSRGAAEEVSEIAPGRTVPDPLPDVMLGAYATWEADIWRKLRNARKAAVNRYLASVEGRHFAVTNIVAEIANSYYELLALDNQLDIVHQNVGIQNNALEIVRQQKLAAKVTELAVRRFEAEVLKTKSIQYDLQQKITEAENHINFLLGRFPQPIARDAKALNTMVPAVAHAGIPSQLMENRPDVRRAELELAASKLDVKVAHAAFYPSLGISAGIGLQAFNPTYLVQAPESILYSLAGELAAPFINRNALKATYYTATAKQLQAVYNYERTVVNAYVEVVNQLSKIGNLERSYDLKSKQVAALTESINISNELFKATRADYMEVLLTQRDALESKFELVETRKQQMNAVVNIYQALGGGWR